MVLTHVKSREYIPENAKIVSKNEALSYQYKFIKNWEKPSEVFFLKYGSMIAGVATFVSAFPIVHHFRKQFKLNNFGSLVTYPPATLMPAVLNYLGYEKLVTSDILLMKMQCPLCMELKYAALHLGTSIFYSATISAVTCASVAVARKTRYLPSPHTEGRELVKLFWNVIKSGSQRYQAIAALQLIVIFFLPYMQVKEFSNIVEVATEKENSRRDLFSSESFSDKQLPL